MKKIILTTLLIVSFQQYSGAAADTKSKLDSKTSAEDDHKGTTKIVKMKGMVCAFCVDNLKKVFLKKDAVKILDIDLETKLMTLNLKPNMSLTDKEIKKFAKDAGYTAVSISNQ